MTETQREPVPRTDTGELDTALALRHRDTASRVSDLRRAQN